jgi:preprotein translocase subunit SecA
MAWKEHLREMDDLKQSVQNAVFEQKDPLLIYKFEGFELFKTFLAKVNDDKFYFIFKEKIPKNTGQEVREARQVARPKPVLREKKEEAHSILGNSGVMEGRPQEEKIQPLRSEKFAGRNDRVSVQYTDGSVKKDVKFKTIEEDLKLNKCVIIE